MGDNGGGGSGADGMWTRGRGRGRGGRSSRGSRGGRGGNSRGGTAAKTGSRGGRGVGGGGSSFSLGPNRSGRPNNRTGRSGRRNPSYKNKQDSDDEMALTGFKYSIYNFKQSPDINDLKGFLTTKASGPLPSLELTVAENDNKRVLATVETKDESIVLFKLSGIVYHGSKLIIKSSQKSEIVRGTLGADLSATVQRTYNPAEKFLNLQSVNFNLNNANTAKLLVKFIAEQCPDVVTINLNGNNLRDLSGFFLMGKMLNNIANLSLQGNQISEYRQLDHLKGMKLREIVLKDNPIESKQTDKSNYRSEVSRRFPSLEYLDTEKVEPVIQFNLPSHFTSGKVNLPEEKPFYFDSESTQTVAVNFVKKYFELYDTVRDNLVNCYSSLSSFSLSAPREKSLHQSYFQGNRNLLISKNLNARVELLKQTPANIVSELKKFPTTKHLPESFKVDAFLLPIPAPQMLSITVHGNYWEDNKVNRFFSRTFVLVPVDPGSVSAMQGWPAVILNDQMNVRSLQGPQPAATTTTTTTTTTTSAPPASFLPAPGVMLTPQSDIDKLMFTTKLTPMYAKQLLEANGNDLNRALGQFMELQKAGSIPAYALST